MSKLINLINLDEIKTLRITCGECKSYWSIPVLLGENAVPNKCNYCKDEKGEQNLFPHPQADRLKKLLKEIEWAQSGLNGFNVSFELEIEKENPLT